MAQVPGTGGTSYVRYAYESTFNTAEVDGNLTTYFGQNVRFGATPRNNIERIPNLNTRNYTKYAAKKFEGVFGVDFQVSNFYFMKAVLGSVATTGAGPYSHTYNEANLPPSLTIQSSEELGTTDSERTFSGCQVDRSTINMNVGEIVTGRLDGFYAKEAKDSTLNANGNAQDSEEPFTFSQATLEIPDATAKLQVQSLELSVLNNAEMIWGLGSRLATTRTAKQRVYELRMSRIREADADMLDSFYGSTTALQEPNTPADVATLEITLDNELATTNQRKFTILLDTIQFEDPTIPLNPAELIKEDVTMYALNLNASSKAVYLNNTASHP